MQIYITYFTLFNHLSKRIHFPIRLYSRSLNLVIPSFSDKNDYLTPELKFVFIVEEIENVIVFSWKML